MQWMASYSGERVPVRDGFNIWPEGWSAEEEAAMIYAWRAVEPAHPGVDASDDAHKQYSRQFEAWVTGGILNDRERLLLDAWTNRNNINRALAWIAPHTFRDLGFETACQVHGNSHSLACGCKVHLVFDHHRRAELTDEDKLPFRAVEVCDLHRRCNSVEAIYWTACRDDQELAHLRPLLPVIASVGEFYARVRERERLRAA